MGRRRHANLSFNGNPLKRQLAPKPITSSSTDQSHPEVYSQHSHMPPPSHPPHQYMNYADYSAMHYPQAPIPAPMYSHYSPAQVYAPPLYHPPVQMYPYQQSGHYYPIQEPQRIQKTRQSEENFPISQFHRQLKQSHLPATSSAAVIEGPRQRVANKLAIPSPSGHNNPENHKSSFSVNSFSSKNLALSNRSKPENQFYCSTCNKAFYYQESYHAHLSSHSTCPHCSIVKDKKEMDLHIKLIHADLLSPKQVDFNDETADWIAQRKKNHPLAHKLNEESVSPVAFNLSKEANRSVKKKREFQDSHVALHELTIKTLDPKKPRLEEEPFALPENPSTTERKHPSSEPVIKDLLKKDETLSSSQTSTTLISQTQTNSTQKRACRFYKASGSCRHGEKCRFSHDKDALNQVDSLESLDSPSTRTQKRQNLLGLLVKDEVERDQNLLLQFINHVMTYEKQLAAQSEAEVES